MQDAIDAAGGLTGAARPGRLNLAQLLTDGQQVVIGTARDTGERGAGRRRRQQGRSAGSPVPSATLDLNRATAAQLEQLPGVGPVTAASHHRLADRARPVHRVEELQEVDGIGPKTYAQIAPHVRV